MGLHKDFRLESYGADASGGLIGQRQGASTVADYSTDFHTRASQSCWNSSAHYDAFHQGLADYIKDELVSYEWPSLDGVIEVAIRIAFRILNRQWEGR